MEVVWCGVVWYLGRGRQVLENGGLSQGGMMEMVLSGGHVWMPFSLTVAV